ncbi:hypothetical protein HYV56_00250 [Candidatus Peregrinibacteria bacterium]|nr:hypothetical protein [Candidatus Peregrinibacteria bacterium]
MTQMIITPQQLDNHRNEIGSKTKNLKKLMDAGFHVPSFIAIPSSTLQKIISKNNKPIVNRFIVDQLVAEIQEKFPMQRYAVRSSALIEDGGENSFAGQFKTKIDQPINQLTDAIIEVLAQAHSFLGGSLEKFSLIIQEYISADYAGICFTRNPLRGREMVLEYHKGIGEDVVSGKIKPIRENFYWHQPDLRVDLPGFDMALQVFKNIETLFKKPQDVEWCIQNGTWYFLQSRPITTITVDDYEEFIFLDEVLPKNTHFFFEKTEISEIASRPTTFTLSLLQALYAKNGPIHAVYSRFGVRFESKNFLTIIGNELYVDREQEIKTLLPSYSYFSKSDFKPRWQSFKEFFRTFKNLISLNKISLKRYDELVALLKEKLTYSATKIEPREIIGKFMEDYKIIFEINVFAEKAIKRLKYSMKNEHISLATILSASKKLSLNFNAENWKGNCLEIADESAFVQFQNISETNSEIDQWHKHLSTLKKKLLMPFIEEARKFNILREYGRYLTVKNINQLRDAILHEAKKMSFIEPRLIYFATISEILDHSASEQICKDRKSKYQNYSQFHFPSKLTSLPIIFDSELLGVSKGKALGRLVTADMISKSGAQILYTKSLTPDLTKYFNTIHGIVSESGGLLSHLAIMAREKGIPVIVNFDLANSSIALEDTIEIDANQVQSTISKCSF